PCGPRRPAAMGARALRRSGTLGVPAWQPRCASARHAGADRAALLRAPARPGGSVGGTTLAMARRTEEEGMHERIRWRGRAARRGVTLVEVLIVVAIMSVIAGAVTLVAFPELRKSRVRTAAIGAAEVAMAAKIYTEVDMVEEGPCPTVPDLVAAKK